MKKGLVLCGGGSKGSYEMGAWTALKEMNEEFDLVTGTSIGCLNAAMYAQHDYERCLELWNKIEVGMIMESGFNFESKSLLSELKKKSDLISFFGKYISNNGADIKPFERLMDEYIDVDKIINSNIQFGICCAKFPKMKGVEVLANTLKPELVKKYILASASCFPVFPICKIEGENYVDGGYYDNLPIDFAIRLKARRLTVIDLKIEPTHLEYLNAPNITYIHPKRDLGGFISFNRDVIDNNMRLGYYDTMKAYGKYLGYRFIFKIPKRKIYGIEDFAFELLTFNASLKELDKKRALKKGTESFFDTLHMYTDSRKLSDLDYYLRAIEIIGDILNMNYYKAYEISDFIHEIYQNLSRLELFIDIEVEYKKLSGAKRIDYIAKLDDKALLKYIFDKLKSGKSLSHELQLNIYFSKPNVIVAYLLLDSLSKGLGNFFEVVISEGRVSKTKANSKK